MNELEEEQVVDWILLPLVHIERTGAPFTAELAKHAARQLTRLNGQVSLVSGLVRMCLAFHDGRCLLQLLGLRLATREQLLDALLAFAFNKLRRSLE